MKKAKNILYLDIEGGWGGSSRSLFYLIKNIDRSSFRPIVVVGKRGPIIGQYEAAGITPYYFPAIPRVTAMEKNNGRALIRFSLKMIYLPKFLRLIKNIIKSKQIDIIHLNHESLFFVGFCFKLLFHCKIVSHIRTMLPLNIWSKIQVALLTHSSDYMIFITENERARYQSIWPGCTKIPQRVIYNIGEPAAAAALKKPVLPGNGKIKVVSMMTVSFRRGTDRLVDVALILKQMNRHDIVFVICGKEEGLCGKVMRERVKVSGLESFFLFLGHQDTPESVVHACDILIRPSRENNPWGRDVIEAMMIGKPIIATGQYQGFIEDRVNGYLLPEFDARQIAEAIMYLSENKGLMEQMGRENAIKARKIFDGRKNAASVALIYEVLLQDQQVKADFCRANNLI